MEASRPNLVIGSGTGAKHDLTLRGLRTLRHLEAHVRWGALSAGDPRGGESMFGGGGTVAWFFPSVTPVELGQLKSARITPAELATWNSLAEQTLATRLMSNGIGKLQEFLAVAGP